MINYKPTQKKLNSEMFQLTNWLDTKSDPLLIKKNKFIDCKNIITTDLWFEPREWITTYWNQVWTASINWQGAILKESWDILVRVFWNKFQKLISWTRTDITTVSNITCSIVSYNCSDLTTAYVKNWTWTNESTNRVFTPNWWWMTINAYASKILRITSWTWTYQEKLITSNDLTNIYIEWIFETIPDATSVYEIREIAPHIIFTNWTDTVFKYDWTTITNLTQMIKFHSIEVQHNKLFWARRDIDFLYFSNTATDFFPKDNYISINQDWDIIVWIQKNLQNLIIYKQNSRYTLMWYDLNSFQLIVSDTMVWCIAQKSITHWNNWNFFLWFWWVYSINTLQNATTDEWLPISEDINNNILSHTAQELQNAVGWLIKNKYYLSIWNEVFTYDINQNYRKNTTVWTIQKYPENIISAFINNWVVYLWSATKTYKVWWNTDNWVYFNCELITWKRTQWDKNIFKIYNRDYINWKAIENNVVISIKIDEWAFTTLWTFSMNTGQIKTFINKRWRYITYKYEFTSELNPSFITHETFFNYLPKVI